MRVLNGRERAPPELRGAAIAMGVLDGVHRGHQALLTAAGAQATQRGVPLGAAVFEPHPREFFFPDQPRARLQTATQRARCLSALGAQAVFQIPFDESTASMEGDAFAREIIVGAIGASHVTIGYDYRYGRERSGDTTALREQGAALGFGVSIVSAIKEDGERISSTAIRGLIAEGKVDRAALLLGRPFAIEGEVITGAQRGRTINFPTANIALGDYVRPKFGVYAVRARFDGASLAGVANIGVKPTVGSPEPLLEAHLFDFSGDIYGKTIEVDLIAAIREERKFESFDALRAQIEADAQTARRLLA